MSEPDLMEPKDLVEFLEGDWDRTFETGIRATGRRLARAGQVAEVRARVLDAGDLELTGVVTGKDGVVCHPELALWKEEEAVRMDADCGCGMGGSCVHVVAVFEYLLRDPSSRVARAFGGTPHAERMTEGRNLRLAEPVGVGSPAEARDGPALLLRVEKRPLGERLAWMPEYFARAEAIYPAGRVDLDPSGKLSPIESENGAIGRDRVAETEALRTLYALDLLPGAEKPPQALRRLDPPPMPGILWRVDTRKWPHPEFFWQRFRHEGVFALEGRGWEVEFAPDVGMRPLVFRSEGWKAEIVDEGKGWFHLSAGFEIEGERFALQPILAALVANNFLEVTEGLPSGQEFMIFLPDGRGLALPVGRFRRILTALGQLMDFPFAGGEIRLSKVDAALLAGGMVGDGGGCEGEEVFGIEAMPELDALAERIADFRKIEPVPVPEGLRATLRDYQEEGYVWMQFLARYGLNGILADDMGLGKTLQTLTHILAEKEFGRSGGLPTLVVAPTSVVVGWKKEAERFAPGLRVLVLQGPDRHRRFPEIGQADLVLTSYALVARDLDRLAECHFHLFVLDEAQYIKNPGAQVSAAVREISAMHRLCLSGTPVENSLGDLWSLMDFLMPGFLGTSESFTGTYRTPIEKGGDQEKAVALARRVGPLILRRTKQDVAKELPPKTEILHSVQLEGVQQDLYETVRSTMDKQVRQALAIRGAEAQIVFLDALLKLRQICCHPSLLERREQGDGPGYGDLFGSAGSAKFEYLVDLLETLRAEGHRTLLFSQFTSMLEVIERYLAEVGSEYLLLTGATVDRQALVERWQAGEGEVFLISLKAGGTGLTLTGADTVIHYDPWWNPAAENQATDRAYRIGQDKPVFVHKLICENTVEERIQQMQARKDDLATDLLTGAIRGLDLTAEAMAELLA